VVRGRQAALRAPGLTRSFTHSDSAARAAWDGFSAARAARVERDKGLDERRKKMKHGAHPPPHCRVTL